MVGGLIVSQALTLFTTPVIYLYLDRLSTWLSGSKAKTSKKPREQPAEDANWPEGARQPAE